MVNITIDVWSTLNLLIIVFLLLLGFYKTRRKTQLEEFENNIQNIPGPVAIPIIGSYWVCINLKFICRKVKMMITDLFFVKDIPVEAIQFFETSRVLS